MATKSKKDSIKEPSVVIRPIGSFGGLDSIHIALIILVAVVVALLLAVAYTKPLPIILNSTSSLNCTYAVQDGKCVLPTSTPGQIEHDAESFLASYNNVNTSLSLLPYYSDVSRMNLTYNPSNGEWYVSIPAINPYNNQSLELAMMINDKNTSKITPLIQTISPAIRTSDFVVSKGVVQIPNQSACSVQSPLQIYWFVDPYSSGGLASLENMTSLESRFKSQVSADVEILFTQSSQNIAATYGLNNSLALGSYLFCASNQSSFSAFLSKVNQNYNGGYIPASLLSALAGQSGINSSKMNSCLATVGTLINRQAVLAKYYNITSTPSIVTDCRYLSIPETEVEAIHYANSSIT